MKRLILALLIVVSMVFLVSWTPDDTARIGSEEKDNYFDLAEEILNGVGSGNSDKEPLNVILIWHQHQPLYKMPGTLEYEMPWVRAHAVNDYPYMADLVYEYLDEGSVTFNYVPSLLLQINDYLENDAMDEYMRLSYKENLTEEEKEFVIEHFFDINPQFVKKSNRYTELQEKKSNGEKFNDQDLLDLKVLWNLYWINVDYIENDNKLTELVKQDGNYSMDDVEYVLDKHLQIMGTIVEKHKSLWQEGKVEMITSPFYHPILPILIDKGWKEDAVNQIDRGLNYFEELFGKKPEGLWPPEQAVHDELVSILPDFGLNWIVTDEAILQKAGISTGNIKNLLKPYRVESNGKELIVFFRDTELSDRIGFNYSSMSAENAVTDFITRLHELQELNDDGSAVITIALDGENAWEHYPNNGNDFRKLLYATLSSDSIVKMVTPEEYLSRYNVDGTLDYLPTGSWSGGSLDTWIGEKEEDEGWGRVEQAREHLMDVKDELSNEALELATDALYVAEGSDWFWWYGADQDAGNNEVLFDKAFKRSLIQLYKATGITEVEIPPELFVANKKPASPESGAVGVIEPEIDGIIDDGEWDKAAYYRDKTISTMISEDDLIAGYYVGRDSANLYLAIQLKRNPVNLIGEPYYLEIYSDIPGAEEVNAGPRYPLPERGDSFGFSPAKRMFVSFRSWNSRPGRISNYNASGVGNWSYDPNMPALEGSAAVEKVVEIKIPFDALGIKTGENFNLIVALSNSKEKRTIDYCPKEGPVMVRIPEAITGREIAFFDDPLGDDYGFGEYVYPKNDAFKPFEGLWDIDTMNVIENENSLVFQLSFPEMTDPWNAPKGFSHKLINIYIDSKEGGRTDTFSPGARVSFSENHPWDYFIKAAGWPSYGQVLGKADGDVIPEAVQVEADPGEKVINIILKKEALEINDEIALYVLSGSQDGYGSDHYRAVTPEPSEWTLGGYPSDAGEYAPFVLDIIVPEGYSQEEILSSYDKSKQQYPVLVPVIVRF